MPLLHTRDTMQSWYLLVCGRSEHLELLISHGLERRVGSGGSDRGVAASRENLTTDAQRIVCWQQTVDLSHPDSQDG